MRQILVVGGAAVLALALMSTVQVTKAPSGLALVKGGQVFAADMAPPRPMPPPPPVGKGKAPIGKGKGPVGKGKGPVGKGKAPIVTKG